VSAIRFPSPNAVLLIHGRRYWDWASDDTGGRIPDVVAAPQVEVTKPGPDGEPTTETIRNPLYSYVFTNDQFRATYFAGTPQAPWSETYRRPEGNPPVSRNDLVSAALASTFTAYVPLFVSNATIS
jgi:tyrosinase